MASTRYIVTATANYGEKTMSNLKSAKREADLRAKGDRQECLVITVASGRVSHRAAAPQPTEAEFAAMLVEVVGQAETVTRKATRKAAGRRAAQGEAAVSGWELLYDKPKQGAQVGRKDGQYALICTAHTYVRPLDKLVEERGLRKAGGWCPTCAH